VKEYGSVLRAAAILSLAGMTVAIGPADVRAQGSGSGVPLRENMPRSWYRNFDYGIEVNGSLSPEIGLYQFVGERLMLIFGPGLETGYIWR
jgi:hypothetical protein